MGTDNSKNSLNINSAERPDPDCASPLVGQEKVPTQCVGNPEGHGYVVIYDDKTFTMTKQPPGEEDLDLIIMEQ
ncbi:hypothetical protein AOLI_G00204740 [Acnodon oligacanthus]